MDARIPMTIEDIGDTNPEAGVMATSPATAPDAAPTVEGLPVCPHDIRAQVTAAMPVAIWVATNALVAFVAAAAAEPALKPNHPVHSNAAPSTTREMLCGSIGTLPYPSLRPSISATTRPDQPDVMWMTVPPAKSSAPTQPPKPLAPPGPPKLQ